MVLRLSKILVRYSEIMQGLQAISLQLKCNFIEIQLYHECQPHIYKNYDKLL